MRFNIKSPLYFNYFIEDTVITSKHSIKDLGVLISSDLTWNLHRSLGLLHHTFSYCNSVSAKKKSTHQINNNVCISYLVHSFKEKVCLLGKDSKKNYKIYSKKFCFTLQVLPNKSTTSPSYDGSGT